MDLPQLPTELQCSIIRYLDPITLISISQTSTHFRRVVRPNNRLLLERLLAAETLPEYGGLCPFFDPSRTKMEPTCDNPAWDTMRLACCRCRRLRSHVHFDNHHILKLGYRKPPAVASVHELHLTSWEPSWSLVYSSRTEKEKYESFLRDKKLRRQYFLCVTDGRGHLIQNWQPESSELSNLQDCGIDEFQEMTEDNFRELPQERLSAILRHTARKIERERAGYKRRHRQCNECRYQQDMLHLLSPGNHGNAEVPIMASRQIPYGLLLDRWFPGVSCYLESKRPPLTYALPRVYRDVPRSQPLTTFMMRCCRCASWKELRDFRIAGDFAHWVPSVTAPGRIMPGVTGDGQEITHMFICQQHCNACFAEAHGRDALGSVLAAWFRRLVDLELLSTTHALTCGFRPWRRMLGRLPEKYAGEAKTLLRHTPCLHQDRSTYLATYADVVMLRHRRAQWREMMGRLRAEEARRGKETAPDDEWWADGDGGADEQWEWMVGQLDPAEHDHEDDIRKAEEWYEEYEEQFGEAEALWMWLARVKDEVGERPGALVEWALERSRAGLTR